MERFYDLALAYPYVSITILIALLAAFAAIAFAAIRRMGWTNRERGWKAKVVVTGSTRGLGLAMANELLKQGHIVAICGRSRESVDQAKQRLSSRHPTKTIHAIVADICKADAVRNLVREAAAGMGGMDAIICNAGYS